MNRLTEISENLQRVRLKIDAAAERCGRLSTSVKLVVVSKGQPLEVIQLAIEAGVRDFGENYPEETIPKIISCAGSGITWHMIGHLQSRKAGMVAERFDWLHSLDSVKLALKLDRQLQQVGRRIPALLQFNVGGEDTKSGWPASSKENWNLFLDDVHQIIQLKNIQVSGLMTMPPLSASPEEATIHFKKLRRLQEYLSENFPEVDWSELSMGTSSDYEAAVETGATIVRIGSAILGPRPQKDHSGQ